MNYKHLREIKSKTTKLRNFTGKNLTVYWNNEFDNFVIHLNGKYWTELRTGEQLNFTKLKQKLYYSHPDNSRVVSKKTYEQIEHNKVFKKEEKRLKGEDAARHAYKYQIRNAVSIIT